MNFQLTLKTLFSLFWILMLTACPMKEENLTYLSAGGIAVANLHSAVDFYTQGLGMREIERLSHSDRLEVLMESADKKGSHITLMQFNDDEKNKQGNPGKIVFYVKDATAFASSIRDAKGQIILPPSPQDQFGGALVGFGFDLDNNLIEIVEYAGVTHSRLSAFGIGVADLKASRDFYVNVVGFKEEAYLEIPGQFDEYILQSPVPGSSALVLMHWTNGSERHYSNKPMKLTLATAYPKALSLAIKHSQHPSRYDFQSDDKQSLHKPGNYAEKDPDGYSLALQQSVRGYLGAAGIGVEDLEASVDFYKNGLGMREVARHQRKNRDEVVLESADARGSNIVLMGFTDDIQRNSQQNPGKLVFYVKDPTAFAQRITQAGGSLLYPPTAQPELGDIVVGFAQDLNNNLIEMVGMPDVVDSYFSAFGIGVSDLESAKQFYSETLGYTVTQFLKTSSYDEYILEGEGGSALVLMHWTNGSERNYKDNPVKLELRTVSPLGLSSAIAKVNNSMTPFAWFTSDQEIESETVAFAKDADGTLLEILKVPWSKDLSD